MIFHAKPGLTVTSDRSDAPKQGGSELDRVTPRPPPSSLKDVATTGVDGLGRAPPRCLGSFFLFFFLASSLI